MEKKELFTKVEKILSEKHNEKIFILAGIIFILSLVFLKIRFENTEVILSVYKVLNPSFLQGDFYADSLVNYHSQYYFAIFASFFVNLFNSSPEIILGFFGSLSKVFTLFTIFYFGKKISGGSTKIGVLTAMLATFTLVSLGGWSLLLDYSRPWSLTHAFLILGITFMLLEKIKLSMFFCGIASIFHPLLGGVVGALCFTSLYLSHLFYKKETLIKKIFSKRHIIAFLIFLSLFLLNLIPALKSLIGFSLPVERFVEIIAYFRHPAHYVPSLWPSKLFFDFALVIFSGFLMAIKIRNKKIFSYKTRIFSLLIFILMIGGYLFVEIFPIKIWISIIGFRYSLFIYLIFIFILAEFLIKEVFAKKENFVWVILFLTSYFVVAEAYALFATLICYLYFNNKFSKWFLSISFITIFIFDFYIFKFIRGFLLIFFLIAISFHEKIKKIDLVKSFKFLIMVLVALILIGSYFIPKIHENFMAKEEYEAIYAISKLTHENATLLIPIGLELIRTKGERKLFVGQEFPFLDRDMEEWYTRASLAWGEYPWSKIGDGDRKLNRNYKKMNDSKRMFIAGNYNVTHAVLFVETKTNFSVLYENEKYKLIEI